MRLQVKARNGHVSDVVRGYAEKRFAKLGRRVHELAELELVLSQVHNPSIADDHVVDAVLRSKGPSMVAKEAAPTFEAAIDRVLDKLERQVERQRDMRTHERRRRAQKDQETPPVEVEEPAA